MDIQESSQERKWFHKAQKEKTELPREDHKKKKGRWFQQKQPEQTIAHSVSPTIVVNHNRLIQIRKFWLIFMFLTGIFFSYVMAIYMPNDWNQFYYLMQTILL